VEYTEFPNEFLRFCTPALRSLIADIIYCHKANHTTNTAIYPQNMTIQLEENQTNKEKSEGRKKRCKGKALND
jgi:hypothetical protein